MKTRGYFYCGLTTTLNIILYALTFGNFLWLEGRVCHGYFRNWLRRFGYRPRHFEMPETEEKIVNLVKNSSGIRTFGAGHSFNNGLVAEDTLVSLESPSCVSGIEKTFIRDRGPSRSKAQARSRRSRS